MRQISISALFELVCALYYSTVLMRHISTKMLLIPSKNKWKKTNFKKYKKTK